MREIKYIDDNAVSHEEPHSRFDIADIRMAPGISGQARDATRFSARRAHFGMLVNCRGSEGRGTRVRRARARVGRLKAGKRGGGEPRAKGRHDGRPSISRPVLRSSPSAGKNSVPGRSTVVRGREKSQRWERNAPFVRETRPLR